MVVEEAATWREAGTGETVEESTVATAFELDDRLVTGVFRHDGLEDALRVAGLDGSDEVRAG